MALPDIPTDPDALDGKFLHTLQDKLGLSRSQVVKLTGLTMGQVGGRVWRYQQELKGAPPEKPGLFNVNLGAPMEIDIDDVCVINDVQAPTTDVDFARLVIPASEYYGVKTLVINGDLLNVDWLSKYPVLRLPSSGTDELAAARGLMEEWLRYYERIILLPGNHEDRFLKANMGHLDVRALVRLLTRSDKVEVSNFDHLYLNNSSGNRWLVAHGANYSINQLNVADALAQKFQANVIVGHQHHLAQGYDRYKRYIIIDNGGLFDVTKMAYVSMRAKKNAGMQQGFTVLKRGYPHLLGPEPWTDWDEVLTLPSD